MVACQKMADNEDATKAPESDAQEPSMVSADDTPAQQGPSLGLQTERNQVEWVPRSAASLFDAYAAIQEISKLADVDVYIAKPSDYPHLPSQLLLFLTSGTGIHSKNNQLQADKYASEGFLVVMPDQFAGDPAPNALTDPNAAGDESPSLIEKVKMGFVTTAKSFIVDMWLARQTPEKVLPILKRVIEVAKEEFADAVANGGGVYAVGYCFGGKYVCLLASELQDIVAGGQAGKDEEAGSVKSAPLIKAGALAHGTLITMEDLETIKSPISMVCVENDQLFPDEVRIAGQEYLEKEKIKHEVKVYKGVPHGFAVVGEYVDPKIQDAQKLAFEQMDEPLGLDVCLYCFNGGCNGDRNHASLHYNAMKHPLALNIQRSRKKVKRDEPPQKISKLAIAAETEEDRYDTRTEVRCYECGVNEIDTSRGRLRDVVDGIMKANTFARQAEVQAWEQEITPCEHTLCLDQGPSRTIDSQGRYQIRYLCKRLLNLGLDLGHCSMCELKENLWLCLQCGNLGCGRAQYGGVGGNSHGLKHTEETSHAVAVKLGSITPEGTADVYCYTCNEERSDPGIAKHLAHWGINITEREKTEKSLTEMQIEQNLKWDFAMTTEDGKELRPLFGEGFTGLKNIGNSCYLSSSLQCLFSLPEFQKRYFHPQEALPSTSAPAEDLETQLRKIADGLLSGRYAKPDSDVIASDNSPEIPVQKGLAPAMLKHLIGRGHEEFSTMRQQDAFELLLHLFKLISRSPHNEFQDPVQSFRFAMEQRLQCISCKRVRYRIDEQDNISIPVPVRRKSQVANGSIAGEKPKDEFEPVTLIECLDSFTAPEVVELTCPACGSKDGFSKRSLFKTFPTTLAVNARRFELVNWVPTKLDVPVVVADQPFDLDAYKSPGLQDGEEELPDDITSRPAFAPNEVALGQLEAMGFPRARCERALHATGNHDADAAMNWLFAHMEDPDIDTPLEMGSSSGPAAANVSPESIEALGSMGIAAPQARKALKETGGDVNRALDWVFSHPDDQGDYDDETNAASAHTQVAQKVLAGSADLPARFRLQSIVCHKGASIHAGHYVAFIRKKIPSESGKEAWVLFNDEKVVEAMSDVDEMKKFAYVYFFERL
ncbi:MAG: hypothetical protein Q9163_000372 [Psora crenata]